MSDETASSLRASSTVSPAKAETETVVAAIDPGSAKCGVAVVRRDGEVLFRAVVGTSEVVETAREMIEKYHPPVLLVGGGTGSRPLLRALEAANLGVEIRRVDETRTSEAARARFVAENPARGWQRLLPRSLRIPDRPYDDYVAVILAERFRQTCEKEAS